MVAAIVLAYQSAQSALATTWANVQGMVKTLVPVALAWITYQQIKTKQVVDATHVLSNSAMGAQLQLAVDSALEKSVLAHRIAELTNTEDAHAAAAAADVRVDAARQLLQAHLEKQAVVDAKAGLKPAEKN